MNNRIIQTWSFSAIEQFRNCPRQFQAERVTKEVQYVETPERRKGNWTHKMFDDYIGKNRALPAELLEYKKYLDYLRATWPNIKSEWRMAITQDFKPCGYFDKEVWCRGQVDVWSVDGKLARVLDWKTGKRKYDYDQLLLMALLTFVNLPEVEEVNAGFFWLRDKAIDAETFRRADWHQHWERFLPDVVRMQRARELDVWQEQPSGLCNGWCPVKSCPYWREKKERR